MLLEIQAKINGDIIIERDIEFKKHPYIIKVFKKEKEYFISFKRKIVDLENSIPKLIEKSGGDFDLILPKQETYQDILKSIQHIESFGALDHKLTSIDTTNLIFKFIPENENDHISPLKEIKKRTPNNPHERITKDWLFNTLIFENQMGELFIPFAFYRDATDLFNQARYQSAFCTYYMMLEYFFHEKKYGIQNDAYKRMRCLNTGLKNTLNDLIKHPNHHDWLNNELNKRNKSYNPEGLLFILNRFRDELSHAVDKNKNRNIFNDLSFFPLAFITMNICLYVSIKKRLLPFTKKENKERFLDQE